MVRHSNTANHRPMTLLDIISAVFEYRWRVAFTFFVVLAISVAAIIAFPKKYESEAKLFVRLGRGSVTMDTTATTSQTISIQESRESEMNSITDMLESWQLAEEVVRKVGAERILKKYSLVEIQLDALSGLISSLSGNSSGPTVDDAEPLSPAEVTQRQEFEKAVRYVMSNTKITSPKKSTTVSISCRARTPMLAREISSSLIDAYQQMHLDAYKSPGAYKFFEDNFAEHERIVKERENAMRSAKDEMAVLTIDGRQSSLQSQLTEVKNEIINTDSTLHAARAKLLDLIANMDRLPAELAVETTSGIANEANDKMRDRLYELEIQEKEYASKYNDNHPKLVMLRKQLRDSQSILKNQAKDREHHVMAVNPVRQDVHKVLLDVKAEIAGLEAKVKKLNETRDELIAELREVNSFELVASDLQRQIRIADSNHRIYAQKLEESRINNALDQEAISNVSLVQAPTLRLKHVSPKRSLLFALGIIFAMLSGIMVAIASDRHPGIDDGLGDLNHRLRQLERRTENLRTPVGAGAMPTESPSIIPPPKHAK